MSGSADARRARLMKSSRFAADTVTGLRAANSALAAVICGARSATSSAATVRRAADSVTARSAAACAAMRAAATDGCQYAGRVDRLHLVNELVADRPGSRAMHQVTGQRLAKAACLEH